MRQSGVLAAAGIVALDKMRDRLVDDHVNARLLAEGVATIPGVELDPEMVQTNIVVFDVSKTELSAQEVVARLRRREVLANNIDGHRVRLVTHKDVSRQDCLNAVEIMNEVLRLQADSNGCLGVLESQ